MSATTRQPFKFTGTTLTELAAFVTDISPALGHGDILQLPPVITVDACQLPIKLNGATAVPSPGNRADSSGRKITFYVSSTVAATQANSDATGAKQQFSLFDFGYVANMAVYDAPDSSLVFNSNSCFGYYGVFFGENASGQIDNCYYEGAPLNPSLLYSVAPNKRMNVWGTTAVCHPGGALQQINGHICCDVGDYATLDIVSCEMKVLASIQVVHVARALSQTAAITVNGLTIDAPGSTDSCVFAVNCPVTMVGCSITFGDGVLTAIPAPPASTSSVRGSRAARLTKGERLSDPTITRLSTLNLSHSSVSLLNDPSREVINSKSASVVETCFHLPRSNKLDCLAFDNGGDDSFVSKNILGLLGLPGAASGDLQLPFDVESRLTVASACDDATATGRRQSTDFRVYKLATDGTTRTYLELEAALFLRTRWGTRNVPVLSNATSSYLAPAGSDNYGFVDPVPCFFGNTLIATPTGVTPISQLREGDVVIDEAGCETVVTHASRYDIRSEMITPTHHPVIIRRGALGDGVPFADTFISRFHRVMTPSGMLCASELFAMDHPVAASLFDTASTSFRSLTYHNLELANGGCFIANGMVAESLH
jgi:hypothetical protein